MLLRDTGIERSIPVLNVRYRYRTFDTGIEPSIHVSNVRYPCSIDCLNTLKALITEVASKTVVPRFGGAVISDGLVFDPLREP